MPDLGAVLALWREASAAGEDYVLATVAHVEGSSYRKPGARMLVTASGRRAGAISGGCLEGEVCRKAWWLTEHGPSLQRYSTFFDAEGEIPYGLGCGGRVEVLLERRSTAEPMMRALAKAWDERNPCAMATVISGEEPGLRAVLGLESACGELTALAEGAGRREESFCCSANVCGRTSRVFAEYAAARPGLFVFGAGDDVQPLLHFGHSLEWYCCVADGRAHLATGERFPMADQVMAIDTRDRAAVSRLDLRPNDAAVLMTHSYEQDGALLGALLPRPLRYLGVLGPRRRTRQLVEVAAAELGLDAEECMARVRGPVGLDLGAEAPAEIALAVAAEIQGVLNRRASRKNGEPAAVLRG
jgi:xanthine dehydrogenase accessory factor